MSFIKHRGAIDLTSVRIDINLKIIYYNTGTEKVRWGYPKLSIKCFFIGQSFPLSSTSTSIVLIPKIINPNKCSDYRPISLCKFLIKIVSMIMAIRQGRLLPKIISPL